MPTIATKEPCSSSLSALIPSSIRIAHPPSRSLIQAKEDAYSDSLQRGRRKVYDVLASPSSTMKFGDFGSSLTGGGGVSGVVSVGVGVGALPAVRAGIDLVELS